MQKSFNPRWATVFVREGETYILTPDGSELPCVQGTKLTDNYNEETIVEVTLLCNIVGSEEEAQQRYKSAKLNELVGELPHHKYRVGDQLRFVSGPFTLPAIMVTPVNSNSFGMCEVRLLNEDGSGTIWIDASQIV